MSEPWPVVTLGKVAAIAFSGVDKHIISGETPVRLCNYLDVYRNRRLTKTTLSTKEVPRCVKFADSNFARATLSLRRIWRTPDDIGVEGGDIDKLGRGTIWEGQIPECLHQNHIFRIRPNRKLLEPSSMLLSSSQTSPNDTSIALPNARPTSPRRTRHRYAPSAFPCRLQWRSSDRSSA